MKRKFKILVLILSTIMFAFAATSCDKGDVAVKSLTLNKTGAVTSVGGEPILLTATMLLVDEPPVWKSSDEGIATVKVGSMANTALIKGVAAGTATITVTAGALSAVCEITVNGAAVLTVKNPDIKLNVGKTATINIETNLSPVSYVSGNPSSVFVNSEGLVTGINPGIVTVTITAGVKQDFCTVTVIQPTIALDSELVIMSLSNAKTKQLTATVNEEAALSSVKWESSNSGVASVSDSGLVTAIGLGEATITAANDNVEATCIVKVKEVILTVTLNQTEKILNNGESFLLTAQITPEQTGEDNKVKWSILQAESLVATIDEDSGLITANSNNIYGKITVRATSVKDADAYADCIVDVPDPFGDWLVISDKASFESVMQNADNVNKKIYLSADIDLQGGTYGKLMPYYSGTFNGRGHTISNFTITSLFSEALLGTVENLGITCNTNGEANIGIFGLYVDGNGLIQNCVLDVTFNGVPNQAVFGRNCVGTVKNVIMTLDNTAGANVMAGCTQGARFNNVFYMEKAGGNIAPSGATLKSESDLKKASTYSSFSDTVWNIQEGSIPTLKITNG